MTERKEKHKRKFKERGITLIALVITIIVLLILAGVALSTLTGDSGILNNAESAKGNTNLANAKEQVELAVQGARLENVSETGKMTITYANLKKELDNIVGSGKYEIDPEEEADSWIVKVGDYEIEIYANEKKEEGLTKAEKEALEKNEMKVLTAEEIEKLPNAEFLIGNTNIKAVLTEGVVIPLGFNYVEGTKDKGVVVSTTVNNVTSEFVWVPVANVSEIAQLQTGSTTNYQGKLYSNWTDTSSTEYTGYYEPKLVGNMGMGVYDGSEELYAEGGTFYNYFTDMNAFGQAMQNDFNAMVESVEKYKGFYIGRYETSENGTTVASTTGTENTKPMDNKTWFELYKFQRDYSSLNKLTSVQSSMIWGSQYDAMLNWVIETEEEASKITSITNGLHELTGTYRPGNYQNDKINNIYDLEGNAVEFTMESWETVCRSTRGGAYWHSASASSRNHYDYFLTAPGLPQGGIGSRMTLCIL